MTSPVKLPAIPYELLESLTEGEVPLVRAYAEQAVRQALAERMNDGYASLCFWWTMVEADSELLGKPIPDDAVILHFMGNGASHQVTARDFRNALLCAPNPQEPPCPLISASGHPT